MKLVNPDGKQINRRHALKLAGSVAVLTSLSTMGIYGCSDTSGNASDEISAAQKAKIAPLLVGHLAAMAVREQHDDLSDLAFNGADGKTIRLGDSGGKYRLVNVWATWCAPCRAEMPALDDLQAKRGDPNFEVIAISVDNGSDEKPRTFFKEFNINNLGFYHDPSMGVFNELKKRSLALGLPVTMLIDENSRVVANMNGPAEWNSDDALKLIDALTKSA